MFVGLSGNPNDSLGLVLVLSGLLARLFCLTAFLRAFGPEGGKQANSTRSVRRKNGRASVENEKVRMGIQLALEIGIGPRGFRFGNWWTD